MNPHDPHGDPETGSPATDGNAPDPAPFHVNAGVFRILALSAVALALPVTLLVMGVLDMRRQNQSPQAASDATEIAESLRRNVEAIATDHLRIGPLNDDRRETILTVPDAESSARLIASLKSAAQNAGASVVVSGTPEALRFLVNLPDEARPAFENALAELRETQPPGADASHSITIVFP